LSSPPPLDNLYSTINGVSFDIFKVTWLDSPAAFENRLRYLAAKLSETGSSTSRATSFSSPVSLWFRTAFPVPIYPAIENFTHSLLVSILIVSESPPNYLQILLNSLEGIVHTELNSVSGIPKFSESRFINERLNSDIFSPPKSSIEYVLIQIWTWEK